MKVHQFFRELRKRKSFLRVTNSFLHRNKIRVEKGVLLECYKTLTKEEPSQYVVVIKKTKTYKVLVSHEIIDISKPSHSYWTISILTRDSIPTIKNHLSFTT